MRWEHWWFTAPLRIKSILRNRRLERELEEELRFHLEHKIDEGIARGLSPTEARRAAMRAMDGLEQRKEEMRDMRRIHWLTDFVDDTRYAIRSLRRTPALAAFVVVTLALGIGLTSSIFSMVDAMVFRPYPVPHASGVMTVVSTSNDNLWDGFSYREYQDICGKMTSFAGVVADKGMEAVGFSAQPGESPRIKGGVVVSGNYFQVLGVQPRLGRFFRADEDRVRGRNAVVVLGPDFWKRDFARDPGVLGKHIRLNGKDFTVVGVLPDNFPGMNTFSHPDFYVPLAMATVFATDRRKNFFEDRDDRELNLQARLQPGVTLEQAQNEIAVLAKDLEREYPKTNRNRGAAVHTHFEMRTRADDVNWKFAAIFSILALAVLLVACTNVAGLLLSRARTRTREIAVRLAIGAGRFRLIRLLLTESLILATVGGLAGIAIGYGVIQWFYTYQSVIFNSVLPLSIPFRMDARALVASVVLTVVCAFLCGLAPALQSTRADLVNGLKAADADVPGRKRAWARSVLVVAQVSMSLMLLTAAFLMVRGFQRSALEAPHFAKDHLLMANFDPRLMQYSNAQTEQFYQLLAQRVRLAPGVRNVALTQSIPLGDDDFLSDGVAFVPEGFHMPRDRENFTATLDTVDEGYFQTMGIPILRGRGFLPSDTANAPRVAVVNEQFAKHYWPGVDAMGQHFRLDSRAGTPVEIVGVAKTITYVPNTNTPTDYVYMPLTQHPVPQMVLMLRSNGDPLQLLPALRDVVRAIDPNLPILDARSYADYYQNKTVNGGRVASEMVSAMGVLGLLLAIAGLYGLVAYNVNRRTREIGIRMAIGAGRADVLRMVMRQGVVLVGMGTAIGLAMGLAVERLIISMVFDSGGVDLVAYATVVPAMFLATMLAAYVPARRAAQIDPTQALRYE